jgi:hypothetical protein
VRQCLERNPEERFQSARDVAFGLQAVSTSAAPPPSPRRAGSEVLPLALLALAGGVALFAGTRGRSVSGSAPGRAR